MIRTGFRDVRLLMLWNSRRFKSSSLSYELIGDDFAPKTAVFIHGVLGSKKNMRTPCKEFVKLYPDYKCLTVDVRGHGSSHNLGGDDTMQECANDLNKLFHEQSPELVLAHSLGGKIALKYIELLQDEGLPLPENTWILDSLPGLYKIEDNSDESVQRVISTLDRIPQYFESRKWVVSEIASHGIPISIAQWLSTSVIDTPQGCTFAFSKPAIRSLFTDFCNLDMWPLLETYEGDKPLHFVRAGRQKKWTDSVLSKFNDISKRNPMVKVHTMPNAGHWLHSEDLPGLLSIIKEHNH
jgi:pimeloyl-ACP methyl ester carboxylesterase